MSWGTQWYDEDLNAIGDPTEVQGCANVFRDISVAASQAKQSIDYFLSAGAAVWGGSTAEGLRTRLDKAPDALSKLELSHSAVRDALSSFSYAMDSYIAAEPPVKNQAQQLAGQLATAKNMKALALSDIRSHESAVDQLTSYVTGENSNPEIVGYNTQIANLKWELSQLKHQFDSIRGDFDGARSLAITGISEADDVLYKNWFGQIFEQTIKPALEIIKTIITILGAILFIVALFVPGLNMIVIGAALALATVAIDAMELVGKEASGDEITGSDWLEFGVDLGVAALSLVGLGMLDGAGGSFQLITKGEDALKIVEGLSGDMKILELGKSGADLVGAVGGVILDDDRPELSKLNLVAAGIGFTGALVGVRGGGEVVENSIDAVSEGVSSGTGISKLGNVDVPPPERLSPKMWPGLDAISQEDAGS